MKKLFPLVLCTIMIIGGCSTNTDPEASSDHSEASTAQIETQSEAMNNNEQSSNEIIETKETIEPTESAESLEDSWRTSYLQYLDENVSENPEDNYGLVFINDDDIPEMAIINKGKGFSYLTYGADNYDVLQIYSEDSSTSVYFHEKKNLLEVLIEDYSSNSTSFKTYEIAEGKWNPVNSGENKEPTEDDFSIKDSCSFYKGSTYEQMHSFLSGNGSADYVTAFKDLYDSGAFADYSGKKYDKYALYDLGNDGSMELIGISKDDIFDSYSYGIASYKDGLVAIIEQSGSDEMMDSTIIDIDSSTVSTTSMAARFFSYCYQTVKNCTMLLNYSIEGEPTSAPAGEEGDEGWSYNPEVDGEYMYYINGLYKGESYVSVILEEWKAKQSNNRKYITFLDINDKYAPDPCERMEFQDFDTAITM